MGLHGQSGSGSEWIFDEKGCQRAAKTKFTDYFSSKQAKEEMIENPSWAFMCSRNLAPAFLAKNP
jgi:hypothetical protein